VNGWECKKLSLYRAQFSKLYSINVLAGIAKKYNLSVKQLNYNSPFELCNSVKRAL
jgi:hypothetical protein